MSGGCRVFPSRPHHLCQRSEGAAGPTAATPPPSGGIPGGGENQPGGCHRQGNREGTCAHQSVGTDSKSQRPELLNHLLFSLLGQTVSHRGKTYSTRHEFCSPHCGSSSVENPWCAPCVSVFHGVLFFYTQKSTETHGGSRSDIDSRVLSGPPRM